MRHALAQEGLEEAFCLDSAGTIGIHAGDPPDSRMTQAASRRGVSLASRARQVAAADFQRFDWILAMDRSNLADLRSWPDRPPGPVARLSLFRDFCDQAGPGAVPDPYYGGPAGFERVLDLLEDGCAGMIRRYREGRLG